MRRQDKYPDTSTFHFYNANPKNRITGDCRIRAIAVACEIPYNQVVQELADIQIETGYDQTSNQGLDILLKRHGWAKRKQPRKWDNTKYTGKEFCKAQQGWREEHDGIVLADRIVANIGGHHIVAIVDGKVWDIWNSTSGTIGNYWTKV